MQSTHFKAANFEDKFIYSRIDLKLFVLVERIFENTKKKEKWLQISIRFLDDIMSLTYKKSLRSKNVRAH